MKRPWLTRLLGVALALTFAVTAVGGEAHQCPVHDPSAAQTASHANHDAGGEQSHEHCSCPQTCCPVGVSAGLPAAAWRWAPALAPIASAAPARREVVLPPTPAHLLPFALAPPHALA